MKHWLLSMIAGGMVAGWPLTAAFGAEPSLSPAAQQAAANKTTFSESQFERQMEQAQTAERIKVNDQLSPEERALIDYGAYLTFNYISVDDANGRNHGLRETDLVGYGRVNLDNVQEIFVRGRASYRDFNHGGDDSFDGRGSREHTALEQAYYKFDLQKYLAAYDGIASNNDAAIQVGRQSVIWGNGLTFDQDIDGGVLDLVKGPITLEAIAGITVPDTVDFDTSRPGFDNKTERGFYGAILSMQVDRHRPYIYILDQRDYNNNHSTVVNTPAGNIDTRFDYNSLYLGGGSTGSLGDRIVYGLEGTVEGGDGLSNSFVRNSSGVTPVNQRREGIRSFAGDARLDYVFADPHNSRASAELIFASGDHDRGSTNNTFNGNQPFTKDLAYNGFGLLNTGLAFAPQVSNVIVTRIGASTDPLNNIAMFRKLEVGADFFMFDKYLEQAPIDEPTDAGRYLGCEPDLFLNWQITSDLTLAMRYGVFFPGQKIVGSDKDRQLFFTGVTLAF